MVSQQGTAPSTALSAVRPEYARLARDFTRLTRGFGIDLPDTVRADIAELASALELTDRLLDAIDEPSRRAAFGEALLSALEGTTAGAAAFSPDLAAAMARLHGRLAGRTIRERFIAVVAEELQTCERMRATTDLDQFVACVVREGRLTGTLALLVAGEECTEAFARFFLRLSEAANLTDKFLDARGDHARAEMALAPTLRLYARLAWEILRRAPALVLGYPRPLWLVGWATLHVLRPGADPQEAHKVELG
jgi:hypothetical protein